MTGESQETTQESTGHFHEARLRGMRRDRIKRVGRGEQHYSRRRPVGRSTKKSNYHIAEGGGAMHDSSKVRSVFNAPRPGHVGLKQPKVGRVVERERRLSSASRAGDFDSICTSTSEQRLGKVKIETGTLCGKFASPSDDEDSGKSDKALAGSAEECRWTAIEAYEEWLGCDKIVRFLSDGVVPI